MVLFMEEPVALLMDMGSMHIESMHMGSMDMRSMDMGTLGEHEHGEHTRGELCYGGAFMAGCLARLWRDVGAFMEAVWTKSSTHLAGGGEGRRRSLLNVLLIQEWLLKTGRRCVLVFGDEAGRFGAFWSRLRAGRSGRLPS